uniref:GmrSD restriction endonucleases N-terminal domain-containing protein n=1 Tax=Caulobacter sp. (strain K31) TaxID=366602 RepID=B0SWQ3_CAUSK
MLKAEIDEAKRLVTTDTVQITIGEIASMYASDELDIIPEFQRLFRWSIEKKSSFIESILIGIPVPPAFAYENADGTWELIDGLQRISTILEFMGLLRDLDNPGSFRQSTLMETKYLKSLRDARWSPFDLDATNVLDKSLQLFFRRARIDFQVLKHPSDPRTKFDLFQRLNRGGAYANEQEVRSCSMVLADREFTKEIKNFADSDIFRKVFKITPEQSINQKNVEYAVRLIVHTFRDFTSGTDVQEFLDKSIISIMTEENQAAVMETIRWTVETLSRAAGDGVLVPPADAPEEIANRFSLRALEAIASGLARNREAVSRLPDQDAFVRERISGFWQQESVLQMSASGLRGTTRIQRTVLFGESWFKPDA